MKVVKRVWHVCKEAFSIFSENHPVKFASAIAYFSLFALPSIFLIIVFFLGLIFNENEVFRELQAQLSKAVGEDGAEMLIIITQNYQEKASSSVYSAVLYAVVVVWLSSQLFRLFQNSLNDLWKVKPDFENYWKKILTERILPISLVLLTGLLFFSSYTIEAALGLVLNNFIGLDLNLDRIDIVVNLLTIFLVLMWFSFLYKVLPSVNIDWQPTLVGAIMTTILFYLGIWLIWIFVVERDLDDIYDKAASIIVVALWVFYSSLVFLYGASLTKAYAKMIGKEIASSDQSYKYKVEEDDEKTN